MHQKDKSIGAEVLSVLSPYLGPEAKITVASFCGAPALCPLARLVAGGGKRHGCCDFFPATAVPLAGEVQQSVASHKYQAFMISSDFIFHFGAKSQRTVKGGGEDD
jgi:hypothetical protein